MRNASNSLILLMLAMAITLSCAPGPSTSGASLPQPETSAGTAASDVVQDGPLDEELLGLLIREFQRTLSLHGTRTVPAPPGGDWNQVTDLQLVEDPPGSWQLQWSYRNAGDNDLNSEVNVSDITPIGIHFGASVGDSDWGTAQAADADGNGEVNISDVTAVGVNYLNYVREYRIYSSSSIDDHPERNDGDNGPGAGMLGIVDFGIPSASSAKSVSAGSLPVLSFPLGNEPGEAFYWVCPASDDSGTEGTASIAGGGDQETLPVLAIVGSPPAGSGTRADPYLINGGEAYQLSVSDPLEGDVSLSPDTRYIASNRYACSFQDGMLNADSRFTGEFSVNATFGSIPVRRDSILHFSCTGEPPLQPEWQMAGHDQTRRSRSPLAGPATGQLAWDFQAGGSVGSQSPVVSGDGTIYLLCYGPGNNRLNAIGPDGSLLWQYDANYSVEYNQPSLGPDGKIYFGDSGFRMHRVDADGNGHVLYRAGSQFMGSPLPTAEGVIYAANGYSMLAIGTDGELDWRFDTSAAVRNGAALSSVGTLYFGNDNGELHAVDPAGLLSWRYAAGQPIRCMPAIGADGSILFSTRDYKLFSVSSGGQLNWSYEMVPLGVPDETSSTSSPAVAADGSIYVGMPRPSSDTGMGALHAVSAAGEQRWVEWLPGDIYSSPAIDSIGRVYIGSGSGGVFCLSASGQELWNHTEFTAFHSSPAIAAGNMLYIGSGDGRLLAFGIQ